ncbi:MAG: DNA-protecting protein DprA, partial [Rhodobacteraceae bacterium]|nr:DNA-protecting protein DprA [Paracoccaceae bacterium]
MSDGSDLPPPQLCAPRDDADRRDWLRLLRSRRVGPATFYRLMGEHGSAAAALEALPEVARAAGVKDYAPCSPDRAEAEIEAARLAGAKLLAWGAADYPASLTELSDAPPLLWAIGDTAILQRPMIALVGARNASSLGTRMARRLAAELSEAGYVVVSGLARGIDTAAHLAAIDGGTLAVMAGGVDVVYPLENAVLAQEIAEKGLRLSEQPMGLVPQARHFPRRNRIVSGLAQAVVVVEAAAKSGSLITALNALDQGREVLAVPGHPFDARASGCNALLRDGATLVRGTEDVLAALTPPDLATPRPAAPP